MYASKALNTKAILKIVESEGLGIDVVSGGELYTALSAGVKSEYIEPWLGYTKKQTILLNISDFMPTNKTPYSYYGEFNVEFDEFMDK